MRPIICVKVGSRTRRFASVEEARAIVLGYIKRRKISRRGWLGGQILVREKEIGRIDYDGNFIARRGNA